MNSKPYILAIESSCDDTSAAILCAERVLSNVIASQQIHQEYGGVVPELASRAHQQNIVPVVHQALQKAQISKEELSAIGFTRGPGLQGSLLVGVSFAKSLALSLGIPLVEVNHLQGHILSHFIENETHKKPQFPFLAMTLSGGHTQILQVNDYFSMEVLGETQDDAIGEAFDKTAKLLGLPYPGGPLIDKYAREGNPKAYAFPFPKVEGLNFSFSGLKTAVLYFIEKQTKENPHFIKENLNDICASIQYTIIEIVMRKLKRAIEQTGIRQVAIGGGVCANSGLRTALATFGKKHHIEVFIPEFQYCTDNAAMIGIAAYFKYLQGDFADMSVTAQARYPLSLT